MATKDLVLQKDLEIYVGNLNISSNEQDLRSTFKDYTINNIKVLSTGIKKYAFLQLDSEASVIKAVKEMNGHLLKGLKVVVRAGNARLHASIMKGTSEDRFQGTVAQNDVDDGPPPLEAVYVSGLLENDMPPPLEPAFENDLLESEMPPPLEPALKNASKTNKCQRVQSPVTLLVANFPFGTQENDLMSVFHEFMPLKISVVVNTRLKDPDEKTYAYITVPDMVLAENAVTKMDDYEFKKRRLLVTFMLERACVDTKDFIRETSHNGPEDGSSEPKHCLASEVNKWQGVHRPVTLLVANFPFSTQEKDLMSVFHEFMPLKISVILNSWYKEPDEKTYAYVTVPDMDLAEKAVEKFNDKVFRKRKLIVTYKLERAV